MFGDHWLCWSRKSCRGGAAAVPQAWPWERKVNQKPAAVLLKEVSVVIRAGGVRHMVKKEVW